MYLLSPLQLKMFVFFLFFVEYECGNTDVQEAWRLLGKVSKVVEKDMWILNCIVYGTFADLDQDPGHQYHLVRSLWAKARRSIALALAEAGAGAGAGAGVGVSAKVKARGGAEVGARVSHVEIVPAAHFPSCCKCWRRSWKIAGDCILKDDDVVVAAASCSLCNCSIEVRNVLKRLYYYLMTEAAFERLNLDTVAMALFSFYPSVMD